MTTLFTDSGTGSNANPVGAPFITAPGFGAIQRLSNCFEGTAAGANSGCYVDPGVVAFPADQWVQWESVQPGGSAPSSGFGGMLHVGDNGSGQTNAYLCQWYPTSGGGANPAGTFDIARWTNGGYNSRTNVSHSWAPGDIYYFESVGGVLTAKINGVTILTSTEDIPYTGPVGLYNFNLVISGIINVTAGDFSSGQVFSFPGIAIADVAAIGAVDIADLSSFIGLDL